MIQPCSLADLGTFDIFHATIYTLQVHPLEPSPEGLGHLFHANIERSCQTMGCHL